MSRGAKITLVIFVIVFVIVALSCASWFIFKQDRAQLAEAYLEKGDLYLKDGNYAEALIAYKKAGLLTPRSFAPYYKQAILAKDTGHYNEALGFLNRAIDANPQEVVNFITLGETNLLNNNLAAAKSAFLEAKKLNPNSDEIDFLLAKVSLSENNFDEAQKYLFSAFENNPSQKYKIYQALLKSFNDPSETQEMLAEINGDAEIGGMNLQEFNNLFQKLSEIENITSREIIIYQAFIQIGEIDFAVLGLEKISKENPEMRDAWLFLSYGYLMQNELNKAKSALDKTIEIDPVFPASYYLLSKYYEQNKDFSQADEAITKAKELGFDENNPLSIKTR